jgi:predicted nucleic acid-binding protein
LDFDDAYQYAVAVRYDLVLVSFDIDFQRTENGHKTPAEILQIIP